MAGFAAPSILFLNSWNRVERDWMQGAIAKLQATGQYSQVLEPWAGAFVMSGAAREVGFAPEHVAASDVHLFSAILGMSLSDGDLKDLGVCIYGEPIPLEGDPVQDAAMLLYEQCLARMQAKPTAHFWEELVRDLVERREDHVGKMAYAIENLRARVGGITFHRESFWASVARMADEPDALIITNPPSYAGAYEKFFDTKGKITWNVPEYEVWQPKQDQPRLAAESENWAATLLTLQLAPHGECAHPDPLYAHDKRRGANDYIWSNKPDLVKELLGIGSRTRNHVQAEKLDCPILPADYEVTEDCEVGIVKLTAKQSRWYKDTWVHRIDFKQSGPEFAVIIDGYLAGMAGYGLDALLAPRKKEYAESQDVLILYYAVGPHHNKFRLPRLVKMIALTHQAVDLIVPPFSAAQAERVVTINYTKHPEFKGNRGLMKLKERHTDPQFGYKLVYEAPLGNHTIREAFIDWLKKEQKWQASRATVTAS